MKESIDKIGRDKVGMICTDQGGQHGAMMQAREAVTRLEGYTHIIPMR